ncbi:hypothetical protein [Methylobacterium dankookense]|uniref:Uncharacterized protein n=1 Tax=Methylobacterium dankookense TaxID=560405 RepID=A0A564G4W9_9HYPH|nr:hypothetical protein [Methylobacterium dankookense]GJD59630.1 hypothetical protein IFDJLNFL_5559 [Methylobacterium dankookense]VUF15122.1 hypothetical protein MTDSW087_04855 [Methylobacterium dankookense]
MPSREMEERHLLRANILLIEAELRFSEQFLRVEHLKANGRRTEDAETLLQIIEETLQAYRDHRELILDALSRAD